VCLGLRTAEPLVYRVVGDEVQTSCGVPFTANNDIGSKSTIDPRLGELLGLTSISRGRCFVSPDMSGYVREPRPTKSVSGAGAHADPIKMPATKTRTPPSTTWKIAESNGVSM